MAVGQHRSRLMRVCAFGLGLLVVPFAAMARVRDVRIPLHDGQFEMSQLSDELLNSANLPKIDMPMGSVNVKGLSGSLLVAAMNQSLDGSVHLSVDDDALVVHIDTDKLPMDGDAIRKSIRLFTAATAPEATAAQARRWGLVMPNRIDPAKPLVILVHGLDMNHTDWADMARLLKEDHQQVAYFDYPDDGPIADDVALLTQHMKALRDTFPALRINLIGYSLGGVVCRAYVEGETFGGEVNHLIMLAPPNHGSTWTHMRMVLEAREHVRLWWNDNAWQPTWIITDGLGEAAHDLTPDSTYLAQINLRPRRANVQYTIVEGDQSPFRRLTAGILSSTANSLPATISSYWGVGETKAVLSGYADELRSGADGNDGPVTTNSAALKGVSDVVTLHADHRSIYCSDGGEFPAAWPVIRDRLGK